MLPLRTCVSITIRFDVFPDNADLHGVRNKKNCHKRALFKKIEWFLSDMTCNLFTMVERPVFC